MGWAWQVGNKSAQKTKNPSQGRVRSDGCPELINSFGPHLPSGKATLPEGRLARRTPFLMTAAKILQNFPQINHIISVWKKPYRNASARQSLL
jgi:hypothetical protein